MTLPVALKTSKPALTVVISAGQSRNPEKRQLEESLATQVAETLGIPVIRVPHLYDLPKDSQTYQTLRNINDDLVVLSWLFDRATHWTLDRNGIRGQVGEVLLREEDDSEETSADDAAADDSADDDRVVTAQPRPQRMIYCIDFKVSNRLDDFLAELARIVEAAAERQQSHGPLAESLARFAEPTNDTFVGSNQIGQASAPASDGQRLLGASSLLAIDEHPGRRWYPVIDFSRCTNCMECIDFCLFGVYGVDTLETIVVEQADNCRKGCPACSRVCPQNAIMFPQHKTPAIAGAPVDSSGLKIDLSKLFGAPDTDEDAATIAARERDEQLLLAGRQAVGNTSAISARLAESGNQGKPADELDSLIDQLDSLDL